MSKKCYRIEGLVPYKEICKVMLKTKTKEEVIAWLEDVLRTELVRQEEVKDALTWLKNEGRTKNEQEVK